MKNLVLFVAILTATVSTAITYTYVVSSYKDGVHLFSGCVYADKAVKLGDTLVIDQDVVLVCASSPHGAVFYPLAHDGVQRVLAAIPAPSK